MPHIVSAVVAVENQIRGQVGATSGASAASSIAIGEAYRLIRDGYVDRVLVGGVDFNCDGDVISGMDSFGAVTQASNNDPEGSCRPFDLKRAGTVLSDGGGMLLLESLESA
jgi:3-oxoacyl-(acyl-carrier-protein) synthase